MADTTTGHWTEGWIDESKYYPISISKWPILNRLKPQGSCSSPIITKFILPIARYIPKEKVNFTRSWNKFAMSMRKQIKWDLLETEEQVISWSNLLINRYWTLKYSHSMKWLEEFLDRSKEAIDLSSIYLMKEAKAYRIYQKKTSMNQKKASMKHMKVQLVLINLLTKKTTMSLPIMNMSLCSLMRMVSNMVMKMEINFRIFLVIKIPKMADMIAWKFIWEIVKIKNQLKIEFQIKMKNSFKSTISNSYQKSWNRSI